MKYILTILLFTLVSFGAINAQIRIGGSEAPNSSAILDLNPDNTDNSQMGLLLPRVSLISSSNASPLVAHTKGMFVYNTVTINDVIPGIYYNDGNKWKNISNNQEDQEYNTLTIPINKKLNITSLTIKGCLITKMPSTSIINIRPLFSNNSFMVQQLQISVSFNSDDNGNINWTINITNKNIDSTQEILLENIIVTYKSNEAIISDTPNIFECIGW